MEDRRRVFIVMGPPLSGKSTFIRYKLKIAESHIFSVRKFFEKERQKKESLFILPPVGVFLSDETVYMGIQMWFREIIDKEDIAFDGFPGNAEQMERLRGFLEQEQLDAHYIWIGVTYREAYKRMQNRKVCFFCDGGVEQASESEESNYCSICGNVLQKRVDDSELGIEKRWRGFVTRKKKLLECSDIKVDLHIHSEASDGAWNLEEIFDQAYLKKIGIIAITDHDTMRNVTSAKRIGKGYGIVCIPGMEMSGKWNGRVIHILGYGMNESCKTIKKYEDEYRFRTKERDYTALKNIFSSNLDSYIKEYENYIYPYSMGGWKLLNFLLQKGIIKNAQEYFKTMEKKLIDEVAYFSVEYVINLIHSLGGYAIAAHPGSYGQIEYRGLLSYLQFVGIDGVEAYHPHNTTELTKYCLEWAKINNKIVTGGSDSHGNLLDRSIGKPDITLKQLNLRGIITSIE